MQTPSLSLLLMLATLLSSAACGEPPAPAAPCPEGRMLCDGQCVPLVTPDVASIHREVLMRGCAGSNSCHGGQNPKEQLDLRTEESVRAMVGSPSAQADLNLIEPFKPELSYFLSKLSGENMAEQSSTGGSSSLMPKGAPALCPETIEVIQQWILNGAQ